VVVQEAVTQAPSSTAVQRSWAPTATLPTQVLCSGLEPRTMVTERHRAAVTSLVRWCGVHAIAAACVAGNSAAACWRALATKRSAAPR
jgi:hypothetical protein